LFALRAHMGGLGIFNPCAIAAEAYQFSRHVADPIVESILNRHSAPSFYILNEQHSIFRDPTRAKRHTLTDTVRSNYDHCSPTLLIVCRRGVLRLGSLLFLLDNTGLCCTKEILLPFLPSDIITSVILLLHLCLRFVMMLRLSLFFNHLQAKLLETNYYL